MHRRDSFWHRSRRDEERIVVAFISPSQINTWRECPRKWGWQKINRLESPTTPAQQFGTDTHQELEDYFVKQVVPNQMTEAGRLAAKGLHLLPAMTAQNVATERKFRFNGLHAVYNGIQDLGYYDEKHHLHVIHDHKTSSSKRYMKTPEVLQADPQAIIYAENFFRENPDETHVILRWLYLFTAGKGKGMSKVMRAGSTPPEIQELIVSREFITHQFKTLIEPVGKEIAHARQTCHDAIDLPYDVTACGNYGGCEFQQNCGLTAHERALAIMTEKPKSPADLLASLTGAPAPAPAGLAQAPDPINPPPVAQPAPPVAPEQPIAAPVAGPCGRSSRRPCGYPSPGRRARSGPCGPSNSGPESDRTSPRGSSCGRCRCTSPHGADRGEAKAQGRPTQESPRRWRCTRDLDAQEVVHTVRRLHHDEGQAGDPCR